MKTVKTKTYNSKIVVVSYVVEDESYSLVHYQSDKKKSKFKVNKEELK